jgi:ubiquinone/menaquinone biosynthesis C-methylase UbiE
VEYDGEQLPFRAESFSGCRIERVLMHVAEPAVVVAETLRCLEPGGLVTVFEPDWQSLVVKR